MKTSVKTTKNGKKTAASKLAEQREVWPLSMIIELSQKILDKGVVKGDQVLFSEKDRERLLSYSSKIEPILSKIRRSRGVEIRPLERVVDELREKIQHFSKSQNKP